MKNNTIWLEENINIGIIVKQLINDIIQSVMKDMTLPRTRGVTGAYHPSGNLGDDLVDVHDVVFCSRRDEAMTMNFLQSFYRWCRYPFGLPRYIEYKRTVTVLTKRRKDITIIGAMFLKELVDGTSHCGDIDTLQDTVI